MDGIHLTTVSRCPAHALATLNETDWVQLWAAEVVKSNYLVLESQDSKRTGAAISG